MVTKRLFRGDDYSVTGEIFTFSILKADMTPLPLAGCTVQSTWREEPVAPNTDPDNEAAAISARISFDSSGAVQSSDGLALPPGKDATEGELMLVANRAVTAAMPVDTTLHGDVQVTDASGKRRTVLVVETITAEDAYTDDPI